MLPWNQVDLKSDMRLFFFNSHPNKAVRTGRGYLERGPNLKLKRKVCFLPVCQGRFYCYCC